jgi:hypothetical protein
VKTDNSVAPEPEDYIHQQHVAKISHTAFNFMALEMEAVTLL